MADIHSESLDRLFKAILLLENVEECYSFFEDLCTINEIQDMGQRFKAAELLAKGESYLDIVDKLGLSTATISRVSKCINYGAGGYNTIIDRLAKSEKDNEQ